MRPLSPIRSDNLDNHDHLIDNHNRTLSHSRILSHCLTHLGRRLTSVGCNPSLSLTQGEEGEGTQAFRVQTVIQGRPC